MRDTRFHFTLDADHDKPPARQVVRLVAGGAWDRDNQRAHPTRTYLRTESDDWVREDQLELEPLALDAGINAAVRRSWTELLELEHSLVATRQLIDADFAGLDEQDFRWALIEAGGQIASVVQDLVHHHCADGSWADHSLFGPASELYELDDAMARLREATTAANERLRMVRMHVSRRVTQRWRADLAALDARIRRGEGA